MTAANAEAMRAGHEAWLERERLAAIGRVVAWREWLRQESALAAARVAIGEREPTLLAKHTALRRDMPMPRDADFKTARKSGLIA